MPNIHESIGLDDGHQAWVSSDDFAREVRLHIEEMDGMALTQAEVRAAISEASDISREATFAVYDILMHGTPITHGLLWLTYEQVVELNNVLEG